MKMKEGQKGQGQGQGRGQGQGFFAAVRILLGVQARSFVHAWQQVGMLKGLFRLLVLLAIAGLVVWGVRSLVVQALTSIPSSWSGDLVVRASEAVLSLVLLGALAVQIFTGLISAFQSLYLAPDLVILFSAPVPTRAVFAAKSVQVALNNLPVLAVFGVMPVIVYGWALGAGVGYYALAGLALIGLWITGISLAELINLVVTRVVPRHRAREAVGVMGALGGLVFYVLFQLPNFASGRTDLGQMILQGGSMLEGYKWLPSGWAAVALVRAAAGSVGPGLAWAGAVLGLGIGLYLVAQFLVEQGFRRGWAAVGETGGGRVQRRGRSKTMGTQRIQGRKQDHAGPGVARINGPRGTVVSVARKDLLSLRRDTREWLGLITPLVIVAIVSMQAAMQAARQGSWSGPATSSMVSVGLVLMVMMSGELASHAIGREGEASWVLNAAPVSGWSVVAGKLIASIIPTALAMVAMVAVISAIARLPWPLALAIGLGALLVTVASSAIGLYLSSRNAQYYADYGRGGLGGAGMLLLWMYTFLFLLAFGYGLAVALAPVSVLPGLMMVHEMEFGGPWGWLVRVAYAAIRPFFWEGWQRLAFGLSFSLVAWTAVVFGFLLATVKRVRRGFKVNVVYGSGKKRRLGQAG